MIPSHKEIDYCFFEWIIWLKKNCNSSFELKTQFKDQKAVINAKINKTRLLKKPYFHN